MGADESVDVRIARIEESMVSTRGELRGHREEFKEFRADFKAFTESQKTVTVDHVGVEKRVSIIERDRTWLIGLCSLIATFSAAVLEMIWRAMGKHGG